MGEPEPIKAGNEKEQGKKQVDCRVGNRALLDQVYGIKQDKKYCCFHYRLPGLTLRLKVRKSYETLLFSEEGVSQPTLIARCGLPLSRSAHSSERIAGTDRTGARRIADAVD